LARYNEEHMKLVAHVPGWKRGRRFKLVEYKQSGKEPVSKYLAIHDFDNGDFDQTAEIQRARSTEWAQRIYKAAIRREVRKFELHKVSTKS
jgi:hypothetical protein